VLSLTPRNPPLLLKCHSDSKYLSSNKCYALLSICLFYFSISYLYYIERNQCCQYIFQNSTHYLTPANSRGPNAKPRIFVQIVEKTLNFLAGTPKTCRNLRITPHKLFLDILTPLWYTNRVGGGIGKISCIYYYAWRRRSEK